MRILRAVCFLCLFAIYYSSMAQPSDFFLTVEHASAEKTKDLDVRAELMRTGSISDVILFYRPYGRSEFIPLTMIISGSTASGVIPSYAVSPPYVEYYLKAVTIDGAEFTYPVLEPALNPFAARVYPETDKEKAVLILSPQRDERVRFSDLVISAGLSGLPDDIEKEKTRLYINDIDITDHTIIADDILVAVPQNVSGLSLPGGRNTIRLELFSKDSGDPSHFRWEFRLISHTITYYSPEAEFRYNISVRGESRNESFAGRSQWYNRSTVELTGDHSWIRVRTNLHVTSEEKAARQPQNRYSLAAETKWLNLYAGDTYPRFPSLIMNGRRLRGFHGQIKLGWFNLDYATGQTVRGIEGTELYSLPADSVDEFGRPLPIPPNSTLIGDSLYVVFRYGTHTRNLTAVRPSFGRDESFRMGFTYLHSKDDIGSIDYGFRPAENLVIGSDFRLSLDRRRIEIVGQAAGSMQNTDIARGNLTREELDELLGRGSVERMEEFVSLSTLQRFITINQYLVPFDPLKFSSLAIETHMRLNYFGNLFQVGYIRRGNDYHSYGLTGIRRDVAGINLRDRLRLMQNQLYLDVSVERLRDNLNNTKTHTTYYNRYDVSVSYFPRKDIPSITVGYGLYKNDNRIDADSPDSAFMIRETTNRFFTQVAHSFFWHTRHTGTLSMNLSFRDDRSGRNADVNVYQVTAMVSTHYPEYLPLRTNVGFGLYHSKIPLFDADMGSFVGGNFNYYNIILGGEYRLLEGTVIINAAFLPTFGDYNRTVYQAGAQYYFTRNLSLVFHTDYLVNPNMRNDVISGLVLRYHLL